MLEPSIKYCGHHDRQFSRSRSPAKRRPTASVQGHVGRVIHLFVAFVSSFSNPIFVLPSTALGRSSTRSIRRLFN